MDKCSYADTMGALFWVPYSEGWPELDILEIEKYNQIIIFFKG